MHNARNMLEKVMRKMLNPQEGGHWLLKKLPIRSYRARLDFDLFSRPHYSYCVDRAACLAKALGLDKVSVIEFGVAAGAGLVALENAAGEAGRFHGVDIEVYGFDSGQGLPPPKDRRDLPYLWQEGFYDMDQAKLRSVLKKAQLVLGDVAETVTSFFERHSPAPVGMVSMDLDYYSSTLDALKLFDADPAFLLPRVYCYFDDIISSDYGIMTDSVGQLRAIGDFCESHASRKVERINGLKHARPVQAKWNDQIYVAHIFDHPDYDAYVHPDKDRQHTLSG